MGNVNGCNEYENFFQENKDFFSDATKKAVFLEGMLAQKLLNIQWQDRDSTPFRSRLNGLKIDEKVVKRLLPEMINKLEEYGKNYYKKLEEQISDYLLKSDFREYAIDELSFYFVMGMNLTRKFDKREDVYENEEVNNE